MKFRFPIVIIDEDFRSENTSGLGIRALAEALEKEGMEVLGVTSYGDLAQFAQQQSRASAFILSIDDEEFGAGSKEEVTHALRNLRAFVTEIRVSCMASFTCSKTRQTLLPVTSFARPSPT
jgi:arginine decarboxylase